MNIYDIIGPVMVGPSSSHTAGAVRIGLLSRKLMDENIIKADIFLHGSFYATGKGHGTDLALVAGLLGMKEDDDRIPSSFHIAEELELQYSFSGIILRDVHPNSALLKLTGISGKYMEIIGSSLGGGRIMINQIDGLNVNFSGNYPTLIVHNIDEPGHIADVTAMLSHKSINIAQMQLYRDGRGGNAVMVIECDQEVPYESVKWLEKVEGVVKVSYLSLLD
ncbi:L-serine ammonia-lyase, iron-sulfur-dependent subunit beta [Mobilitalea sibirica]|uniref:L-serine deaminase n=1 Tax=Mobilitalea sibirica TaxID=1462919 RepID=A0A8J7GWR9_9FIRM|nr:L-serine ammonia-lyase, iron-sulfur-dependent subunit beta [Mobilitalea sibirica]MBH1939324.1 L-serine ammonia-lyase, iron-sulfur-dependent subunit beta [Mobilitalea sibirica]